jgi:hypothetical protein
MKQSQLENSHIAFYVDNPAANVGRIFCNISLTTTTATTTTINCYSFFVKNKYIGVL